MKTLAHVFTFLLLLGLCVASAMASPMLDFSLFSGGVGYNGGSTPFVGTGIAVFNVQGLGTPANNGVSVPIYGTGTNGAGTLDFTTGDFTGLIPPTWNFSGGGSVTINGCADIDLDGRACDAADVNGLLLTGTFTGTPSAVFTGGLNMNFAGSGSDTKNSALLEFFGLTGGGSDSFTLGGSFESIHPPPPSIAFGSIFGFNGSLQNTIPNAVPEPSTLALLGAGLLGLGSLVRRKSMAR